MARRSWKTASSQWSEGRREQRERLLGGLGERGVWWESYSSGGVPGLGGGGQGIQETNNAQIVTKCLAQPPFVTDEETEA